MEWRQPCDELAQRLAQLCRRVLANRKDPIGALSGFEPLLYELYTGYDETNVDRLGWMGYQLRDELEQPEYKECAPEV